MIIIFFILGLIIGSFLNVVIYRLDMAETLLGRSACLHCRKKIRWYDNIPFFSFLILRARCRDCGEKISWQYPVVEVATGIVFALAGNYFFNSADSKSWLDAMFYLGIFSALIVITVYDLKFMEIPMVVLWLGVAWTIAYLLIFDWLNFIPQNGLFEQKIFSGILAGAGAFLFFFALSAGSKEKWMGMGDAYVAMLVGLIVGWPSIVLVLMVAFCAGALSGIVIILLKKGTMKSQIPFAPFLAVGTMLAVFLPQIYPQIKYLFAF